MSSPTWRTPPEPDDALKWECVMCRYVHLAPERPAACVRCGSTYIILMGED